MIDENNANEASVRFLLAEFANVESERLRLKSEAIQRLNFFLTVTSAVLGGLLLFTQFKSTINVKFEYVAIIALGFLSIIGWQTFRFVVQRDINTDLILRAGGRIRRFFVDNDPAIKPYLMWEDHDEPTGYVLKNDSAIRRTNQTTLALLLSLMVGIIVSLFLDGLLIFSVVGLFSFVGMLMGLEAFAGRRFRKIAFKAQDEILHPKKVATDR